MKLAPWMRKAQPLRPVPRDLTPKQIREFCAEEFCRHMCGRYVRSGRQPDLRIVAKWMSQYRAAFKLPD